jgi:hypothetical protein
MRNDEWKVSHPIGSNWHFAWTADYLVTVTGHTRRGIRVSYKRPGYSHTTKAGIYQPEELVPLAQNGKAGSVPP